MENDSRKHSRVVTRVKTEILIDNCHLMGHAKNMSLGGVLMEVNADKNLPVLTDKTGTIWLLRNDEEMVEFDCKVVRQNGYDLAVMFVKQDIAQTMHLKKIMETAACV